MTVARAAERAAADEGRAATGLTGAADRARGRRAAESAAGAGSLLEVTSVTVMSADEEPADAVDEPGDDGTASDWLPGIRDEHDDEGGWQARWLDRPTWDRTVTPNIRRRTGQRPARIGAPSPVGLGSGSEENGVYVHRFVIERASQSPAVGDAEPIGAV